MINSIPKVIYDKEGNLMRVVKTSRVYFKNYKKYGYVFHVEREDRVTSVSEFELVEDNGNYIVTRDVLKSYDDI